MAEKRKADEITPSAVDVPIEECITMATKALQSLGWSESDAKMQAEIMTHAETQGNNQGLVKLLNIGLMAPVTGAGAPEIERDTPCSAVVNGHQCPGMLALVTAADAAIEKGVNGPGIAVVGTNNTCTSSGQLAFYGNRIASKGLIGIVMANSPEFVAPAPGAKAVFGTNPICVAIPTADGPLIMDMATASIALFGVLTCKANGTPLPPGSACKDDGTPTTDPNDVPPTGPGAILAFGGHKGAALALVVELLAGALPGAAVLGQTATTAGSGCEGATSKKEAKSWGHTVIAIKPDLFVDDFPAKASSICAAVKASGTNVILPGEIEAGKGKERKEKGTLPIPAAVWESITTAAAKVSA